jgi:hypothetical protein
LIQRHSFQITERCSVHDDQIHTWHGSINSATVTFDLLTAKIDLESSADGVRTRVSTGLVQEIAISATGRLGSVKA